MAFRKQDIPVFVGQDIQGLIQSTQDLGERVTAWPTRQPTPKGWTRFKAIALPFKAMGSTAWLTMGFKDQNLLTRSGSECGTAQAADPTADHDHLSAFWHQ